MVVNSQLLKSKRRCTVFENMAFVIMVTEGT
jgi:hypothetical protein